MKSLVPIFGLVVAAGATSADAATITVNHVMNPASVTASNIAGEALAVPVTLGVGDTLDMTITFAGGASLQVTGEDGLWPLLLSNGDGGTLQVSGTLEFLGASANIKPGLLPFTNSNSFAHIGQYQFSTFYRLNSSPITFSGIRQIITITSDDIGAPREYQRIALTYFTGQVGVAPAIPEPASWALMICGFGLVGGAVRNRARVRVAFT